MKLSTTWSLRNDTGQRLLSTLIYVCADVGSELEKSNYNAKYIVSARALYFTDIRLDQYFFPFEQDSEDDDR